MNKYIVGSKKSDVCALVSFSSGVFRSIEMQYTEANNERNVKHAHFWCKRILEAGYMEDVFIAHIKAFREKTGELNGEPLYNSEPILTIELCAITFDVFWEAYHSYKPEMSGHKNRASKAWAKLKDAQQLEIYNSLTAYFDTLKKSGFNKKHCVTYINQYLE